MPGELEEIVEVVQTLPNLPEWDACVELPGEFRPEVKGEQGRIEHGVASVRPDNQWRTSVY